MSSTQVALAPHILTGQRPVLRFRLSCTATGLSVECTGLNHTVIRRPAGDVAFIRDYPLPRLEDLADAILDQGVAALAGMPDNTLCAVVRRTPEGREWILARDRFGNTPLVCRATADSLVGGSSAEELAFAAKPGTPQLDRIGLGEYSLLRYTSGPHTLLSDIMQPLASHAIVAHAGKVSHEPYDDFRRLFGKQTFDSVAARMPALIGESLAREPEGAGIMFSGGLDSTLLAWALPQKSVPLYTISLPGMGQADMRMVQSLTLPKGRELRPVAMTREDFAARLPGAIRRFGWPLDHPNFVARDALFEAAAADGVTRLLTGDGSDTVLGGGWYIGLWKAVLLKQTLPRGVDRLPVWGSRAPRIREILDNPMESMIIFDDAHYPRAEALALLPDALGGVEHLRTWLDTVANWHPVDQAFFLVFVTTLSAYPSSQRAMAWQWGVDLGYPFIEAELVEAATGVTGRARIAGMKPKRLLDSMVLGAVPEAVRQRPKSGLPIPLEDFVLGVGGLDDCWGRLLRSPDAAVRGVMREGPMDDLLRAVGNRTATWNQLEVFWMVLSLELWLRQFVRGERLE